MTLHRNEFSFARGNPRRVGWLAAALTLMLLAACAVGPDYERPSFATPDAWNLDPQYAYWHLAAPTHAQLDSEWWRAFGDDELDTLERRALEHNETLREVAARYDQARALLASESSSLLPEIGTVGQVSRGRISANRALTDYGSPNRSTVQNDIKVGAAATWEIDLFGRVRREIEAAHADAQQSSDDLANARLAVAAELASTYFALRTVDDERDVLARSIEWQQKALEFVSAQERFGQVSSLSVLEQRTQLDATRVQLRLLLTLRAQYEHAIATMIGENAPQFSLASAHGPYTLPRLPTGVPSEVLERRPDVAAAERAMAAANARIGAARAAYFPSLTLSPGIGWESTRWIALTSAPSLVWSLGATVGETLFDGGRRKAQVAFANAGYAAAHAHYRATVLTAFQEVQDAVTNLAVLDAAAREANESVDDAQRLLTLATYRYRGGQVDYLDVIAAQKQVLTSEREQVQVRGRQANTVVFLAKALGGGWQEPAASNR